MRETKQAFFLEGVDGSREGKNTKDINVYKTTLLVECLKRIKMLSIN